MLTEKQKKDKRKQSQFCCCGLLFCFVFPFFALFVPPLPSSEPEVNKHTEKKRMPMPKKDGFGALVCFRARLQFPPFVKLKTSHLSLTKSYWCTVMIQLSWLSEKKNCLINNNSNIHYIHWVQYITVAYMGRTLNSKCTKNLYNLTKMIMVWMALNWEVLKCSIVPCLL